MRAVSNYFLSKTSLGQMFIDDRIDGVPDDTEDVEPRQDGFRQVHVLGEGHAGVVATSDGIGGSNHRTTGLQSGHNASLEKKRERENNDNVPVPFLLLLSFSFRTFEMEMVCCSMASWMEVRSESFILSNSSIRQTPLSAKTRAPASSVHSRVTGDRWTYAVKPTALAPCPVVKMALTNEIN